MEQKTLLEAQLQRDTDRLRGKVMDMAGRAERALRDCQRALAENNRHLAYLVILRDQHIDELEREIDRLCLEFLVRQQPVARHLRFVYVAIKLNRELERIGDYAESIARQILKLSALDLRFLQPQFDEIANVAIPMLHNSVRSFLDQDAELALKTMSTEAVVDALRNRINVELIRHEKEGRIPLDALTPLMTIARRFERAGDQAKNICEEVLYLCTGEYAKHPGGNVFRILFLDDKNASLSQMAEAIGHGLGQEQFLFSSAGLEAGALDPRTIAFLEQKRLDISSQGPKTLEQVPNLEQYQVIVTCSQAAAKAQKPHGKAILLDWATRDPAQTPGSLDQAAADFEAAYRFLDTHIRELVHAILNNEPATPPTPPQT